MSNNKYIICKSDLDKFYLDIVYCDENVYLDFLNSLNHYERLVFESFLIGDRSAICYSLRLIYNKFYDFIKMKG